MTPGWAPAEPIDPADLPVFDASNVVTEDDAPVDNFPSEKAQRLLTEPLYTSWSGPPAHEGEDEPRTFLAAANVGMFGTLREPPIVPDVFLSLDVQVQPDFWEKENRSYFIGQFGKPPEVVIEIVSNEKGQELDQKFRRYAWMHVTYYVVWDPNGHLGDVRLRVFELQGLRYEPLENPIFKAIGLGVKEWTGTFEQVEGTWLRWCLPDGTLVPTGAERVAAEKLRADTEKQRAEAEKQRADDEKLRADTEKQRADDEKLRAEKLAAQLRALGIDPEKL